MLNVQFIIITINAYWFWLFICLLCFISFFFEKQKIINLKKSAGQNFVILFLFLLKVGSFGPRVQQINFVLPQVFLLKFICNHFYITIIHKSIFLTGTSLVHLI